jgi:hypothetical protein
MTRIFSFRRARTLAMISSERTVAAMSRPEGMQGMRITATAMEAPSARGGGTSGPEPSDPDGVAGRLGRPAHRSPSLLSIHLVDLGHCAHVSANAAFGPFDETDHERQTINPGLATAVSSLRRGAFIDR